jgi:succinoglycan biosynthesis protein ExoM
LRVAVCITTCKRPKGLDQLLDGLNKLTFNKCPETHVEIVVIDNDPEQSVRTLVIDKQKEMKYKTFYYLEKQRGISFARNKALEVVKDKYDLMAFIDDDEVPEPNWLDELIYVHNMYDAAVVSGPVLPLFVGEQKDWIRKGAFFDRPRYSTGTHLENGRTGNVLMSTELLKKVPQFDTKYALTGGEDTLFFKNVKKAGFKMIWSDQSIVYEWVPESRAKMKWLFQRSYRVGNTISLCDVDMNKGLSVKLVRCLKAMKQIMTGGILLVFSILGKHHFVKAGQRLCMGLGMINGILGRRYEEYKNIHRI